MPRSVVLVSTMARRKAKKKTTGWAVATGEADAEVRLVLTEVLAVKVLTVRETNRQHY